MLEKPSYDKLYAEAQQDPESFWGKIAQKLTWSKPWDKILDWKFPYARWFTGAKCNIIVNTLDRHQENETAAKTALIWEGQDGSKKTFTYRQLNQEVCRFANALKSLGVQKGDRITIYLPRIPEQFIAMLACAKIGAIHSVVFSGFSAEALKGRIEDAKSEILITANAYPYGKKLIETKKNVDEAIADSPLIKKVIVVKRLNKETPMKDGRDIWWDELVSKQPTTCETEVMEANDPLFVLYTSGTTGEPKGILHGHGGYMVGTYFTLKSVFDLQPDDIYFCTADVGWITGHSYIVYAPLINGATIFVYEGTPDYPDPGKWWQLVEKYKITKFYTAPTAIRALEKYGEEYPKKYDLSSLKILGSVGEPINPEAWLWYHKNIGGGRCPIMDTWWQTETGMFLITPLPDARLKPGSAFKPFPGIEADVVDETGKPVAVNKQGFLIIKKPWPAMFLDVYQDPARYKETYFEKIPGVYFTGDSAKKDEDGYFWIIGRNDDVIKVSGHRLGSAELETAIDSHPAVVEAAVIGKPHEVKGESIKAFVILKIGHTPSDQLKEELKQQVRKMIGPIATPDEIDFVEKLPKTRSGKIMRRVLKAQELGQDLGDISTLEN